MEIHSFRTKIRVLKKTRIFIKSAKMAVTIVRDNPHSLDHKKT